MFVNKYIKGMELRS